jgi:hypothetical protein
MDELYLLPVLLAASSASEEELLVEANAALAMVLVLGANEGRLSSVRRRNQSRIYLRRPQLISNPRLDATPWQKLYESYDDRAYITCMGFDVDTFQLILQSGFGEIWESSPIPRGDASSTGHPRAGARSLDAAGARTLDGGSSRKSK